jgi:hypothetical protein
MHLGRTCEFRGLEPNPNPFVGFGLVEAEGTRLALSSHMLRQPLWVDGAPQAVPTLKPYYEAQGFSKRRYKVFWHEGGPMTPPLMRGGNQCRERPCGFLRIALLARYLPLTTLATSPRISSVSSRWPG